MSSSHKPSKSVSDTTAAATAVHPIPTNVSAPPEGWVDPPKLGRKGRRPKNGLTLAATTVAGELRDKAAALVAELGPKAVDPTQLAAALDRANQWEGADTKAASFHLYTRAQRNESWDAAIKLMEGMKAGVQFALSRDASFADRFPGVAKTFAPAKRSKKKATAAAPEAATPAAETPAAPAAQGVTKP